MARETPWSNWEEWMFAKELLFSFEDSNKQLEGINILQTWKSRLRNGALPVSIELTATLVAANMQIHHYEQHNEHQAKLAAAMALVRFVNGITDQLQTGLYAQSVQLIAEKIDIPDWIVDLRHEITHAQLPSMAIISSGVMVALNWLYQNYWEETTNKIEEQEKSYHSIFLENVEKFEDFIRKVWPQCFKEEGVELRKIIRDSETIIQSIIKQTNQNNLALLVRLIANSTLFVFRTGDLEKFSLPIDNCEKLNEDQFSSLNQLALYWKPYFKGVQDRHNIFISLLVNALRHAFTNGNQVCIIFALYMLSVVDMTSQVDIVDILLQNPSPLAFQMLEKLSERRTIGESESLFLGDLLLNFKCSVNVLSKSINLQSLSCWWKTLGDQPIVNNVTKLIEQFAQTESKVNNKSYTARHSKWRKLSEAETNYLPPMGELPQGCNFPDMHLKKRVLKLLNISDMDSKFTDGRERVNVEKKDNFNQNLVETIDRLFVDSNVEEFDTTEGSTLEYVEDEEMTWENADADDDDDILVDVKNSQKIIRFQNIEASSLDVSKIVFF